MGKRFPVLFFLMLTVLAPSACNRTANEACLSDLPRLEAELARAEAAFARPASGRAPASLKEGWKDEWKDWAHDHLTLTQEAMDALEEDPSRLAARRALEGVANGFVEVYALAEEGRDERLPEVVSRLKRDLIQLRSRACGAPACRGIAGSGEGCAPGR